MHRRRWLSDVHASAISCLVQVQMFCCLFRMLGMRISCLKGKCSTYNNRRSAAGLLRDYLGKIITRTDYLGKHPSPRHVLWPQGMYYGHNTCTIAIVHVLWPCYMYYGHSTCMYHDHSTCMYCDHNRGPPSSRLPFSISSSICSEDQRCHVMSAVMVDSARDALLASIVTYGGIAQSVLALSFNSSSESAS